MWRHNDYEHVPGLQTGSYRRHFVLFWLTSFFLFREPGNSDKVNVVAELVQLGGCERENRDQIRTPQPQPRSAEPWARCRHVRSVLRLSCARLRREVPAAPRIGGIVRGPHPLDGEPIAARTPSSPSTRGSARRYRSSSYSFSIPFFCGQLVAHSI